MDDLVIDDVKQLVNFYKQRASDLELQVLQLQLKIARIMSQQSEPVPATKTVKNKN